MSAYGVTPWTRGNTFELLQSGTDYFPALLTDIERASQEIFLETYLFARDPIGDQVAHALAQAAQRGIAVHILVDGFGGRSFIKDYGEPLLTSGVRLQIYRPERGFWNFRKHRLRRLHRKLVVIDRRIAFVGGINIVDDHNAPHGLRPRVDFALRAQGPVVAQTHQAALRLWAMVARTGVSAHLRHWQKGWMAEYRRLRQSLHEGALRQAQGERMKEAQDKRIEEAQGERIEEALDGHPRQTERNTIRAESVEAPLARFLPRDNLRHRHSIANAYLDALESAQHSITLAHAYFLPGFRFRHALRNAARRGVRVTILLQGSGDHPFLQYATRALYGSLLRDGIELHEYRRSFLHAKVAVVDQHWLTVGSSNIDPFSLWLAQEGNLEIRDAVLATRLEKALGKLIENGASAITLPALKRAGIWSRIPCWIAYGCVRLMLGLVGFGSLDFSKQKEAIPPNP